MLSSFVGAERLQAAFHGMPPQAGAAAWRASEVLMVCCWGALHTFCIGLNRAKEGAMNDD